MQKSIVLSSALIFQKVLGHMLYTPTICWKTENSAVCSISASNYVFLVGSLYLTVIDLGVIMQAYYKAGGLSDFCGLSLDKSPTCISVVWASKTGESNKGDPQCNVMLCPSQPKGASPHEMAGFSPTGRKTRSSGSVRGCHDAFIKRTGTCQRHFWFFFLLLSQANCVPQLRHSGLEL